ncbi:hypothetical protein ACHHYP_10833 [Achlya hypogyna]|uniref:Uncharacterized protein n=1 Tax=Achlya hypogyna TaxID=1202772 RepID=A0A1V9YKD5_ACHHY|nr:hypothetical protein ACHHYP_10833 [Achlya hypogyna]
MPLAQPKIFAPFQPTSNQFKRATMDERTHVVKLVGRTRGGDKPLLTLRKKVTLRLAADGVWIAGQAVAPAPDHVVQKRKLLRFYLPGCRETTYVTFLMLLRDLRIKCRV